MCGLAGDGMENATRALLTVDLALAEQVINGDARIDALRVQLEDDTYRLLALQAPVARDLRLIVTAMRAAEKIERIGDLAATSPSSPDDATPTARSRRR